MTGALAEQLVVDDADARADVEDARAADAARPDHFEQHPGRGVGPAGCWYRSRSAVSEPPVEDLEAVIAAAAVHQLPKIASSSNGARRLELVVAAGRGRLVRAPALERRRVPEPVALQVVVGDLDDALGAERLPRQVLAAVPARRRAWQPLAGGLGVAQPRPFGPFLPRVALDARSRAAARAPRRAPRAGPTRTTT